jgi:hypothetical protein
MTVMDFSDASRLPCCCLPAQILIFMLFGMLFYVVSFFFVHHGLGELLYKK